MKFLDTILQLRLTPIVGVIAGLTIILLGNAVVFARVMYNRSGEPEIWTFTERELNAPWRSYRDRENSGVTLTLSWQGTPPETLEDSAGIWAKRRNIEVDKPTLESLGFPTEYDCARTGDRRYQRLAEHAWAALEYNGPTHRKHIATLERYLAAKESEYSKDLTEPRKSELKSLRARVERVRDTESRLYAIDVAVDRKTLEQRYADSDMHLILPATIMPWFYCNHPVSIYVASILTSRVHVPKQHRDIFGEPGTARYSSSEPPPYYAEVAYGKLKEPWLMSLALRDDAGDSPR